MGLSEGQLIEFALGGGLDGGATRNEAALARAIERLKKLLLVGTLAGGCDQEWR